MVRTMLAQTPQAKMDKCFKLLLNKLNKQAFEKLVNICKKMYAPTTFNISSFNIIAFYDYLLI